VKMTKFFSSTFKRLALLPCLVTLWSTPTMALEATYDGLYQVHDLLASPKNCHKKKPSCTNTLKKCRSRGPTGAAGAAGGKGAAGATGATGATGQSGSSGNIGPDYGLNGYVSAYNNFPKGSFTLVNINDFFSFPFPGITDSSSDVVQISNDTFQINSPGDYSVYFSSDNAAGLAFVGSQAQVLIGKFPTASIITLNLNVDAETDQVSLYGIVRINFTPVTLKIQYINTMTLFPYFYSQAQIVITKLNH